jgi:hypothetical protein
LAPPATRPTLPSRCFGLWGFADFDQFTGPDAERFPEFTPALRQAMYDEVVMFLDDLFRHDRSLTAFLDSDYTFANVELAKHYGIEHAPGTKATKGIEGIGEERWRA